MYYGTHQDETRFFRATAPGVWQDLDPASVTGQPMDGARVIAAPHPSFMLATALTPMYQPVYFVWTQSGGLNNLASTVVDLPPSLGAMQAVDANASGCILVNTTGVRKSFLLTPLAMGDTNGDGLVNGVDLGRTLGAWGPVPAGTRSACDFDGDGKVDGADLGMLLTAWQP